MLSAIALVFVLTICVFLCLMVGAVFAIFSLHMFMLNEIKHEPKNEFERIFKDDNPFNH